MARSGRVNPSDASFRWHDDLGYAAAAMRPAILNPLFAEVTALRGVGAALAKPLVPLAVLLDALEDLLSWEGGSRLGRLR